jgi:hypothetical protein
MIKRMDEQIKFKDQTNDKAGGPVILKAIKG